MVVPLDILYFIKGEGSEPCQYDIVLNKIKLRGYSILK